MKSTDRVEKVVTLKAPVSRVWRALVDSDEFGRWFGVRLDGPFVEGGAVRGSFGEGLDAGKIEKAQASLGLTPAPVKMPAPNMVFCTAERIEPERRFSFRWIPFGIDATVDPKNEPTTLVEFLLEPTPEGTRLTIVESGFDKVPAHRRERAFRMNDVGWAAQAKNIERHVEAT